MLESDPVARTLDPSARASLAELAQYRPLRDEIELFWLIPEHRQTSTWGEHADINDVMLATSLAPDGFLVLAAPKRTTAVDTHPAAS
jgi:hypothetical protein